MKEKVDYVFNKLKEKEEEGDPLVVKETRKKFKVPLKIKGGAKKKIKQNKVLLLKLSTIGNIKPEWVKIQDGMVYDREAQAYHIAENKYLMNFMGKYPCMLVPEWSMKPYSPKEGQEGLDDKEKDLMFMQKFLIKVAKMEALDMKKTGGGMGKNMFIIGIIVIAVVYMILKGLGLQV